MPGHIVLSDAFDRREDLPQIATAIASAEAVFEHLSSKDCPVLVKCSLTVDGFERPIVKYVGSKDTTAVHETLHAEAWAACATQAAQMWGRDFSGGYIA